MRNRRSRRNNNRLDRPQHHFGPVQSHLKPVEILSDDQVEAIHKASLRVLEETGIEIMSPAYVNVARRDVEDQAIPEEIGGGRVATKAPEAVALPDSMSWLTRMLMGSRSLYSPTSSLVRYFWGSLIEWP